MSRLFAFFQRFLNPGFAPQEDHLGGLIDLSDDAYCLGLLTQDRE
ncbi:hypothetical protein [Massilia cavernae]|nr:hypothetical protein [Massilia cavernae]